VEEAETRGLITLDHIDGAVEVRVAHPLYGEVRRKRTRQPGCDDCAGSSPLNSAPAMPATTFESWCAAPH